VGKNSDELGGRFLHRGRRKRDTDVGPANPVSLPGVFKNRGDVSGCALHVNRPKAWRHQQGDRPKKGMIMIAGSMGFGRL
jgi:hypothetical protein